MIYNSEYNYKYASICNARTFSCNLRTWILCILVAGICYPFEFSLSLLLLPLLLNTFTLSFLLL